MQHIVLVLTEERETKMIDKDKLEILRIAARSTPKDGDVLGMYESLLCMVSLPSEAAPKAMVNAVPKQAYTKKAGAKYPKNKEKHLADIERKKELILQDMITQYYSKGFCNMSEAMKNTKTSANDYGAVLKKLINGGYLEKQGHGPGTIWTILRNPDGAPFNPNRHDIKILPPGRAYG